MNKEINKEIITSYNNSQIKNLISLQKKSKERETQGVFIVEGIKMFEEAKSEGLVHKAYISDEFYNSELLNNKYNNLFKDIDYNVISTNIFKQISDTVTPQGVMCVVKQPNYILDDILNKENANIFILESIRDPGNLGTIIRTGEGSGITGIVMNRDCVDIYNPKVVRSTMGSIFRVPFVYVDNLNETIDYMKSKDITILAAHLNCKNDYDKENYSENTGFLIGNEAHGLSEEIASKANKLIKIPMNGKVESLNVAVATSILMYEVFRQRKSKGVVINDK